jgi:Protein of unknown function (DUF2971)
LSHFFKYVCSEVGGIIIKNGTLRWSTPALLNDVFDMQFDFQLRLERQAAVNAFWKLKNVSYEEFSGDQEISDAIEASVNQLKACIAERSKQILNQFTNDKILCLSDIPDSLLMWSHYARNHSGMVLRFTDQTTGNPLLRARRVQYLDRMPSLFDEDTLSRMLAGGKGLDARRIMDEVIYTKSSHWAYEREWRVYAGIGRSSNLYEDVPFNARELDGVIFGVRTPEDKKGALVELLKVRYPHVELLQAKVSSEVFGITVDRLRGQQA